MRKRKMAGAVGVVAAVMVLAGCAPTDPVQAMAEAYLDPDASEEAHTKCDGSTGTGGLWAQVTAHELIEARDSDSENVRIFEFDATDTDGEERSLWVTVQLDSDGAPECIWGASWYD